MSQMSEEAELLPCPFCGTRPTLEDVNYSDEDGEHKAVHCPGCTALGPSVQALYDNLLHEREKETDQLAGEAWDRRALLNQGGVGVEKIAQEIKATIEYGEKRLKEDGPNQNIESQLEAYRTVERLLKSGRFTLPVPSPGPQQGGGEAAELKKLLERCGRALEHYAPMDAGHTCGPNASCDMECMTIAQNCSLMDEIRKALSTPTPVGDPYQVEKLREVLKLIPKPSSDYSGGAPGCGACGKITRGPGEIPHYEHCWWIKVQEALSPMPGEGQKTEGSGK